MIKSEHKELFYNYTDHFLNPQPLEALQNLTWVYDLIINVEYDLPKSYTPQSIKRNSLIHIGATNWQKKQNIYRHLLDGVAAYHIPVSYGKPKIYLSPQAREAGDKWFVENNVKPDSLKVVINPGSNFPEKMWPVSRYKKVCQWLIKNYDANILVIGNESVSQELFNSVKEKNIKLIMYKPIGFVSAILSKYDLFIGNDSGTSHLAAALGVPTVAIFGPTSPGVWKPAGRKSIVVYNHNIEFDESLKNTSEMHKQFLEGITVNDVIDGIILSISKYIGFGTKRCLDTIEVADALDFKDTINGVIISNMESSHSCLIRQGWEYIANILDEVNKTNSFNRTIEKFPNDKQLLEFLLLHRIIKSAN